MSTWLSKQQDLADALGWDDPTSATVDGLAVCLSWSPTDRNNQLHLAARFPHPMDLGLRVHLGSSGETSKSPLGDPAFDGIFAVYVADGDAGCVPALLDAPERAALAALAVIGYPRLDDFGFEMDLDTYRPVDELRRVVTDGIASAGRVARRAESLPPPTELRVRDIAAPLTALATSLGLRVRANQFLVRGDTSSAQVEMRWRTQPAVLSLLGASVQPGRPGYLLRARFHEPLTAGLRVERSSALDRAKELVGLGDVHTGDRDFDRAWTVRARDPELAVAALGDGARAHLDRLVRLGATPVLTDAGVEFEGAMPNDGEAACEVLRVVDELRERLRPRTSVGPYR